MLTARGSSRAPLSSWGPLVRSARERPRRAGPIVSAVNKAPERPWLPTRGSDAAESDPDCGTADAVLGRANGRLTGAATSERDAEMPKLIDAQRARRERYLAILERQEDLLALTPQVFSTWCSQVALLDQDSVPGLVGRLSQMVGDRRYLELKRAEEAAVDQLDRTKLMARWEASRLTRHQLEYWEFRRPKEIPRIDGHAIWFALTLPEVVDHD